MDAESGVEENVEQAARAVILNNRHHLLQIPQPQSEFHVGNRHSLHHAAPMPIPISTNLNIDSMMKKSNYNIRIPAANIVVYYNSFTDQFLAMSPDIDSSFCAQDWKNMLETRYPTHLAKLKELGFVIETNRDELSEIRFQNKQEAFNSRNLLMMVYPTQDCNLKCWYCYESHVPDSFMSQEVQDRIVRQIEKRIERNVFDSLRLSFFGGEPMLRFSTIAYPLAKRLKDIVTDAGKSFQTFFITNATLIGDTEIDMLKEINPYFQITIDGNRNKHDVVRVRKHSKQPTYDTIIGAVKGIVNKIYNPEYKSPIITVRINYDNNTLANLQDLITDLEDIDRSAIMIHLERVWQTMGSVDDYQRMLLKKTISSLTSQGFYVSHGIFGEKRVSCPAESVNYFIVNYDGSLYRCNGRTLHPELKEGELSEDGDLIWDEPMQAARLGLATFENPHCLGCKMLPRCMGPCSQKLAEHNGFCDKICTLKTMDIPLNEYLLMEFEKRMTICGYERFK